MDSAAYEEARLCAHRILRSREKTSFQLQKRLQELGHSSHAAQQVTNRFVEVGLVDDKRYTQLYIRSAQASNKGWRRIRQELQQRGIAPAELEALLPPSEEEELQRAQAVIARCSIETHKDKEKAFRKLQNKGFSIDIAKQAIEAVILG
ncbi:MAG: recombination regulator RecX [Coriobacteriia bacterium]|nr:recombination regulator RecX [Coriobacteriia bacterium]